MPPHFTDKMSNDVKATVLSFLDNAKVEYEIVYHEAAHTIEQCAKIEELIGAPVCKNLLLSTSNESRFVLLIMRSDKPFVTKTVSKKLGVSRLSFAKGERMEELLNTHPGSLSILGLMFDTEHRVQLAVDEDLTESEYFGCHPCDNTSTLKLKTKDIFEKILPLFGVSPTVIEI